MSDENIAKVVGDDSTQEANLTVAVPPAATTETVSLADRVVALEATVASLDEKVRSVVRRIYGD